MSATRVRDSVPDVMRSIALFGILLVHIPAITNSGDLSSYWSQLDGFANGAVVYITSVIFASKFYLLFSFLFGYSANYILKNDPKNRKRWVKRCFVLLVLGALHGILIWPGDILFTYGLFGLLLIPFFFRTNKTLKIWTYIICGITTLHLIGLALILLAIGTVPELAELAGTELGDLSANTGTATVGLLNGLQHSTFAESLATGTVSWLATFAFVIQIQGGFVFAAFLLGYWAARSNFLSSETGMKPINKMIWLGLSIGIPIQLLLGAILLQNHSSANPSLFIEIAIQVVIVLFAPILTVGYIGLILKILKLKPNLVNWMKPAGKMSLTIYVSESIVISLILAARGWGLSGDIEYWQLLPIAVIIWIALILLAKLWLKKFNQGPLEWLVHVITKDRNIKNLPNPAEV